MEAVHVLGIHADPTSAATIVLLGDREAPTRVLPIFIGPAEARAILVGLSGIETPRPGTHDLMLHVIEACETQLERVAVTELVEGTFIAVLELTTPWGPRQVSARPSDAIALATRTGVPVVVAEQVLDEAAVDVIHTADQPFEEAQIEKILADFRQQLADATVDDFADEPDEPEEQPKAPEADDPPDP